jgi:FixJ family two-component response regulator
MQWRNSPQDSIVSMAGIEVKPTVYVVDDDISVREALEALICEAGWLPIVFSSAKDFLSHARSKAPSCLVLDVSLPDLNGLELQQRLLQDGADMPVIFITGYGDVPTTVRAMKAGAIEFLTKPFGDEALIQTIGEAIERSSAAASQRTQHQALQRRFDSLSTREREVMALVVTGLLNKQVGGELGISEITVKAHRGRVMRKMEANSLADLVNIAAQLGIVSRN